MIQTKIHNFNKKHTFLRSLLSYKKSSIFHKVYYYLIGFRIFYNHKKILKYLVIGLPGTIVDFFLLFFLTKVIGVFYLISTIISYFFGMSISFILQKKYTFKQKTLHFSSALSSFLGFFSVSVSSILITLFFMAIFVEIFKFNYLIAKVVSDLIVLFYKYRGHSFCFKSKTKMHF